MADKYAPKELSREEWAANVMHARLGPASERFAAMLAEAGVLESGDEVLAIALLSEHLGRPRAAANVRDLQMYHAMATPGAGCG